MSSIRTRCRPVARKASTSSRVSAHGGPSSGWPSASRARAMRRSVPPGLTRRPTLMMASRRGGIRQRLQRHALDYQVEPMSPRRGRGQEIGGDVAHRRAREAVPRGADRARRYVEGRRLEPEPGDVLRVAAEAAANHHGPPPVTVEPRRTGPADQQLVRRPAVPWNRGMPGRGRGVEPLEPAGGIPGDKRLAGEQPRVRVRLGHRPWRRNGFLGAHPASLGHRPGAAATWRGRQELAAPARPAGRNRSWRRMAVAHRTAISGCPPGY